MQRRARIEGARLPASSFHVRGWATLGSRDLRHSRHASLPRLCLPTCTTCTPLSSLPTVTRPRNCRLRMHSSQRWSLSPHTAATTTLILRPLTTQLYECADFGVRWKLRIKKGDGVGLGGFGGVSEYPFSRPQRSSQIVSERPKTPVSYL